MDSMLLSRNMSEKRDLDSNSIHCEYIFHEEIGSGGFGKVKSATHVLTGEKVAIKIIDKKAIGPDLPRVTTELEALKHLSHQNICKMFQFTETREKFYIVMEYCNGGEMFDYIVRKERLSESEARHFFRQLVQAVAYIHHMGFAHRDLKPENLLLTSDLQLKVIDFGLCAKPINGLNRPLETCCGSPAYAAPELIKNHGYYGNEADIWSMGVLLYALLCGTLPFDDNNVTCLYNKILSGNYYEPNFLSAQTKELLRSMLTVNPKHRITIKELLVHPWLNKNYQQALKWNTIYNKAIIDEDVSHEIGYYYNKSQKEIAIILKEWKFDYLSATYLILLQKKERRQKFTLPIPLRHNQKKTQPNFSPLTIHASLENDLDFSDCENAEPESDGDIESTFSDDCLIKDSGSSMHPRTNANYSKQQFIHTPPMRQPRTHETVILRQSNQKPDSSRPTSIYTTPRNTRVPIAGIFSPALYRRPNSADRPTSHPMSSNTTPLSPKPLVNINSTPTRESPATDRMSRNENRSEVKTPRLSRRIYASLERKADRMITLLTPKKFKGEAPTKLKCTKTMVNVSVTSSTDPEKVRNELWRVLLSQGMVPSQNGWKISGTKPGRDCQTVVELEVVSVENLDYVGVKRRRIRGDAFVYKEIVSKILCLIA